MDSKLIGKIESALKYLSEYERNIERQNYGDWEERLMKDPQKSMTYTLEQQYTAENLHACKAKIKLLNDTFRIVSYKKHLLEAKTKPDVDIIIFHGIPRPHQCDVKWVKEAYK